MNQHDWSHNLIGGQWVGTANTLAVLDPGDGTELGRIADSGAAEIDEAVRAARSALESDWGRLRALDRGRLLSRLSAAILDARDRLAVLEARDTGKPISQATADITACARYFEYYAGAADKIAGQTIPTLAGHTAFTLREPHGVTGHIIAWNAPAQMFGRTLAPALAMGNATVLKPAEQACLTTLELGRIALDAGLPGGALNIVSGAGERAGAALVEHPGVDHISFTGSPEVGTMVQAVSARHNRPVTIELGGKSPQIVFDDADLDRAVPAIMGALLLNTGQTCSAGSRLLVHDTIADKIIDRLSTAFGAVRVGRFDTDPDCGPLISEGQRRRVEAYVALAVEEGLPIVARAPLDPSSNAGGYYLAPTMVGPVAADHRLAQEEIFGPVLVVTTFTTEAEAIQIANGTPYGLVAGVWTRDGARQLRLAHALRCGQVFVNNYGAGGGVELPFGGVKRSGFGREKGLDALLEYSVVKTVVINHG